MPTYKELQAQLAALTEQAEAARLAERDAVIAQIRDSVSAYGLTEEVIFGRRRAKRAAGAGASSIAPKYRDPKAGGKKPEPLPHPGGIRQNL